MSLKPSKKALLRKRKCKEDFYFYLKVKDGVVGYEGASFTPKSAHVLLKILQDQEIYVEETCKIKKSLSKILQD